MFFLAFAEKLELANEIWCKKTELKKKQLLVEKEKQVVDDFVDVENISDADDEYQNHEKRTQNDNDVMDEEEDQEEKSSNTSKKRKTSNANLKNVPRKSDKIKREIKQVMFRKLVVQMLQNVMTEDELIQNQKTVFECMREKRAILLSSKTFWSGSEKICPEYFHQLFLLKHVQDKNFGYYCINSLDLNVISDDDVAALFSFQEVFEIGGLKIAKKSKLRTTGLKDQSIYVVPLSDRVMLWLPANVYEGLFVLQIIIIFFL